MISYIKIINWLKSEKYGYLLEDGKTWINYGELNDKFPYDENNKKWELSRNRMIDKTISKIELMLKENAIKEKQIFNLGDEVYFVDEDYNYFEAEVTRIEIYRGKILYTADCEFENKDVGDWVFESELFRQIHMENIVGGC